MPELTREEKLKLIETLPQQLQDFLYSEDLGAFLFYLERKYNLAEDKISALARIIVDIILGITPITSLAQEINLKVTTDAQAAMNLAQELNTELLAPAMTAPSIPPTPATPAAPVAPASTPAAPAPTSTPSIDHYREPTIGPEVVDLRKVPPPTPPAPSKPIVPPTPITPVAPAPKPSIPPLTFTRPIEPPKPAPITPLIEAEPHQMPAPAPKPIVSTPKPIDTYREPPETQGPPLVSAPIPISTPPVSEPRPQYIMRPSGAPPTDLPDNVLDLRKDKGEF